MARLGIDLGTSNSAAALFREGAQDAVIVIPAEGQSDGANVFPSYVAFDMQGNVSVVGRTAKERYREDATGLVVRHFKRLIGRNYDYVAKEISKGSRFFKEFEGRIERGPKGEVLIKVADNKCTVIEIASFLLKKIKDDAEVMVKKHWGESIDEVTISLPAGFEDAQRQDTKAAAEAAGFSKIKVIEEPTAAAIAKGIEGVDGNFTVVDIGAGTTDIVIGHSRKTEKGPFLVMSTRKCDDLLGGLDMDYLILEYVLEKDQNQPRLCDIYPRLDIGEKNRLMASIELAKITASLDGRGNISFSLRVDDRPKRINVPLDEETLNKIVSPLVNGYQMEDNRLKGIKPLVENALLDVAENDPQKVTQVKQQIRKLILVGGPCRMRCIHEKFKELFKENEVICKDLHEIDPLDTFFMEAVAKGAALKSNYNTIIPHDISTFHWGKGRTLILPKGTPYNRDEGKSRSAQVPVHSGDNSIYIISERDSSSSRNWTMRRHLVKVPQNGDIQLMLHWGEGGTESGRTTIEGAGLPGKIKFPAINDTTTLGGSLEEAFKAYLVGASSLRQRIMDTREPLRIRIFKDVAKNIDNQRPGSLKLLKTNPDTALTLLSDYTIGGTPVLDWIERQCTESLAISEGDLSKCEAIDPETEFMLPEEDIKEAFNKGYFELRDKKWAPSRDIPKRAIEVLNLTFIIEEDRTVPREWLLEISNEILNIGRHHATCSEFVQQLEQWLEKMKINPADITIGYMVAMALNNLSDCLHDLGSIGEETYNRAKGIAHKFSPEDP